jgi:hypothetical protein
MLFHATLLRLIEEGFLSLSDIFFDAIAILLPAIIDIFMPGQAIIS